MRYVSTRGEAPPLGFIEATLAGLARDGGLYVPEAFPRLGVFMCAHAARFLRSGLIFTRGRLAA